MRQTVQAPQLLTVLTILAFFVALLLVGHGRLAVVLLVLFLVGDTALTLVSRRRGAAAAATAQSDPTPTMLPRTHRTQESVWLPHAPEVVWDLVYRAENGVLLSPGTKHAYKVPGTPDGIGEQQAFVALDGSVSVLEVLEFVPHRLAVCKVVAPPPTIPMRSIYAFERNADGTVLTFASEYDLQPGQVLTADEDQMWRDYAADYFDRIRSALAARAGRSPA